MKKATFLAVLAALALPAAAQQVQAPSNVPPKIGAAPVDRIDKRQAGQQKRIDEGVKSGQIDAKEAERLKKQQARIQKMEDKARADGKVTKQEARRIERAQDRASRDIRRDRHDKK